MNKFLTIIIIFFSAQLNAQNTLKGVISDKETGETLIGANVVLENKSKGTTSGTATDFNGEFNFKNLKRNDDYQLIISYIGYEAQSLEISFDKKTYVRQTIEKNIQLVSDIQLDLVTVVSDQAEFRKTPVSLSNVKIEQIEQELAGQEIPMLLNSTPGVYATQQGGGDGDVDINIRGFNQEYVAVMIDGVPMNDMENGWVYWSNWFGLDAMTRTIQVQRGLGASKLALPSIGGTINIMTKGLDAEEGGMIKQEIGSGSAYRTSFGYTTKKYSFGKFNIAGSFKRSNGIIEGTQSRGLFYYLKWQNSFDDHVLSFAIFGAPQNHNQRKYGADIELYDKNIAAELGVDTTGEGGYGLDYNPDWSEYNTYDVIFNQNSNDTIWGEDQIGISYKNYYHKPTFNLQHLWEINEKSSLTNVIYYSRGSGGGTTLDSPDEIYDSNNQIDFQEMYDQNSGNSFLFGQPSSIKPLYSSTENKSTHILTSSINNHSWLGALSTYNYKVDENFDFAGGLDLRTYKGEHYREIYDLIGGDYFVGSTQPGSNYIGASNENLLLRQGDKLYYHNDGLVRWLGGFGQVEYKYNNITAFLNLTGSHTFYKRIDYFKKQDIVLEDTTLTQAVGVNETIWYDGNRYTLESDEARFAETNWEVFPGYTVKLGANWNINQYHNAFFNAGVLSKAPNFNNVFMYDNTSFDLKPNTTIEALEFGYGYRSKTFSLNFNTYFTAWYNKPTTDTRRIAGGEIVNITIIGMNALHRGMELDFGWKISDAIKYEFLSSFGDWRWTSDDATKYEFLEQQLYNVSSINANGIHVGGSPQTQIGSSISYNYKINKNINGYLKLKGVYFDRLYAYYNVEDLAGEAAVNEIEVSDVWRVPDYALFSLHMGNNIDFDNSSLHFKFNILNLFDNAYISAARNNDSDFPAVDNDDAESASVFFGLGRKIITSIEYKF
ncbi:MAG: hypothetical protein CMD26_04620 [Flavobacteriales bacterium]|nr:hypothetical protein [Flavobacteriales bacterium]|tara:strand:+ start:4663 stop:7488 length:2826 start_codon:yes stop_codon:yes gene_type:complete